MDQGRAMMVLGLCVGLLTSCLAGNLPSTAGEGSEGPEVTTSYGAVRGSVMTSMHGRQFSAFRGIPFAQPPLADLRFRPPQPALPWDGVLDATQDAAMCIQKNYLLANPTVQGSEDCLYLNIYTPKLNPEHKLDVMLYVHGGGWFSGSGASSLCGPHYLMDKDVILVTFNYRLGALGFLSTGDEQASGNYGMKDQVAALRWVSANIAAFGGNPDSVTMFGQSAGGASVHYHILSPMSKGLFHKAISQSGTALCAWAWPKPPLPIAQKQAGFVNCPTSNTTEMLTCLKEVDAIELVDSGDNFHFWSIDPLTTYVPVIETNSTEERFLTDHPETLIKQGLFNAVPWIQGVVENEGIIRALPILKNETLVADLSERLSELGPKLMELGSSLDEDLIPGIWTNISKFYFKENSGPSLENVSQFIDLYTDRSFLHGSYKAAIQHAAHHHSPSIYMYNFAYRGVYSFSVIFGNDLEDYGVSHCDELIYLFNAIFPAFTPEIHGSKVVDELLTLWTNFAKYGNPTPHCQLDDDNAYCIALSETTQEKPHYITWEPISAMTSENYHLKYLNIAAVPSDQAAKCSQALAFTMTQDLHKERIAFWENLPLRENKAELSHYDVLPEEGSYAHISFELRINS